MVLEESAMASAREEEEEEEGEGEGEDQVEYESDPEEVTLSLAMRRREASDDEEGEEGGERGRVDPRAGVGSDAESDGQGGAAMYDEEDESEIEEEEEEEEEEEDEEVEEEEGFEDGVSGGGGRDNVGGVDGRGIWIASAAAAAVRESVEDGQGLSGEMTDFDGKSNQVEGGEKKENEPFAVPTAGAFYMHDDRFRDSGGGRHRHTLGGRKLWESKDDRKWGHDKFEEMTLQETQYEKERRKSRGRYRGRSRNQSMEQRAPGRGNRPRIYDDRGNQNHTFKTVRGRGPRRYEPPAKNIRETVPTYHKQSGKLPATTSNSSTGKASGQSQTSKSDAAPARKNVFASSLNSASPPFYPSGSSTQDISVPRRRDLPVGSVNKNTSNAVVEERFSTSQSSAVIRGKSAADSTGQDRFYVDESIRPVVGKFSNLQLRSSGSSANSMGQPLESKPRGRNLAMSGQINYQPATSNNQANKAPQQIQLPAIHQRAVQNPVLPSLRVSTQPVVQHSGSGSQASSPRKLLPAGSSETGEVESPPGSNKSKNALVAKGKGAVLGNGRGSFLYNGAQVIGTGGMGVGPGDQNFPGAPALLPVMQFGGQHPGGLGVPAVGMALPGYVAQPHGFGNSEMTWVPVLAGAAGALGAAGTLGATYCPPYLAVDGSYYARSSGQTSSSGVSSKETSTNKPNNGWKPPQRPELVNDEFGQRQNKPRRYSEMNFGQ